MQGYKNTYVSSITRVGYAMTRQQNRLSRHLALREISSYYLNLIYSDNLNALLLFLCTIYLVVVLPFDECFTFAILVEIYFHESW